MRSGAECHYKFPLRNRGGAVYRMLRGIIELVGCFPRSPGQYFVRGIFERFAAQFPGIKEVAIRLAVQGGQAVRGHGKKGGICPKIEGGTDLMGEPVKKKRCADRADDLAAFLDGDFMPAMRSGK